MKVLLTGATGLVGREVGKELVRQGHHVFVVSRDRDRALREIPFPARVIEGNLAQEPLRDDSLQEVEAVIHLAGENISHGRWSSQRKRKIYDSRINSSKNLILTLAENKNIKTFISASAVGFYGDRGDEILNEFSCRGVGFLSEVCQDWEQPILVANRRVEGSSFRSVLLRFGMVLSPFGGALSKMMIPVRMGLAGCLGEGCQWMSWIHIDDLVQLILNCLTNKEAQGVINAVSPEAVTNKEFMFTVNQIFKKKMGPPLPAFILKAFLGEMSQILLYSQRVESLVIEKLGFKFKFPQLQKALEDVTLLWLDGAGVLCHEQYLPGSPEKNFIYFSEVKNFEQNILPEHKLKVEFLSAQKVELGTQIRYRVKVHNLLIHWVTEIKKWQPSVQFEASQVSGPYIKFQQVHRFEVMGEGTLVIDLIQFRLPLGFFGYLTFGYFILKEIDVFFQLRRRRLFQLKF